MSPKGESKGGKNTRETKLAAPASALGINVERSTSRTARLWMEIKQDMLNGHDVCHGGFIFTLATAAIDHAAEAGPLTEITSECSIEFLRPATQGDILTAELAEAGATRRSKIYDVRITNQDGETIALLRGRVISSGANSAS